MTHDPRRKNAYYTSWGTSTSRTVATGHTPRVGDVLLAFVHLPNTDSETVVSTTGGAAWTKLGQCVWSTSNHHMSLWAKISAGANDSSIDIAWTTSVGYGACVMLEYQPDYGTTLSDLITFDSGSMIDSNLPSATTIQWLAVSDTWADRGIAVAACGLFSGSGGFTTHTAPQMDNFDVVTAGALARTEVIDGTITGMIYFGSWFAGINFNWTTARTNGAIGCFIPTRQQNSLGALGCS